MEAAIILFLLFAAVWFSYRFEDCLTDEYENDRYNSIKGSLLTLYFILMMVCFVAIFLVIYDFFNAA